MDRRFSEESKTLVSYGIHAVFSGPNVIKQLRNHQGEN